MKKAPKPFNETERLEELLSYEILDTEEEAVFDDFTKLASQICQTPIALISLVDKDRQWFKSKIGIDIKETPRDPSFCGHAILGRDLFEVQDPFKDERFHDNPFVMGDLRLRFYAGAPIIAPSGNVLGTLCVIDHKTKTLSTEQRESLMVLARQVVTLLELRKSNKASIENFRQLQELGRIVFAKNKQLIESAKLATIGEMASGIAHEINNPVAVIMGKIMMLQELLNSKELKDDILKKELGKLMLTAERISKIVKTMRNLSRGKDNDPFTMIDSYTVVQEVLSVCEEKIKHSSISVNIEKVEKHVFPANVTQFTQVLLNLIQNSIHAIQNLDSKWIEISCVRHGGNIRFSVTDSGSGISKDIVDEIMNPFFTTKPAGEGTGLGLSIAKTIITSHRGTIGVDQESKNTSFYIELPVAA